MNFTSFLDGRAGQTIIAVDYQLGIDTHHYEALCRTVSLYVYQISKAISMSVRSINVLHVLICHTEVCILLFIVYLDR